MSAEVALWLGLVASVLSAAAAQADVFPTGWRPWVTLAGVLGTAISGWLMRSPRGDK
jgi:hypothetical protein